MRPVWMHASVRPEAIAAVKEDAARTGELDHRFHYAGWEQARRWLALHEAYSPAARDCGVEAVYRRAFAEAAEALRQRHAGRNIAVAALGSGGGRKDRWLVDALRQKGLPVRDFIPVDVSPELALVSAETMAGLADRIWPVAADLARASSLAAEAWELAGGEDDVLRVVTLFGMMPNFDPDVLWPRVKEWLQAEGGEAVLLASANLAPVAPGRDGDAAAMAEAMEQVRPQYDNPETRAWLTRVVTDWGLENEWLTDEYRLSTAQDGPRSGRFVATVPHRSGGRIVRLFFSRRLTPRGVEEEMGAHGLAADARWISPSREEGVWMARPDAAAAHTNETRRKPA